MKSIMPGLFLLCSLSAFAGVGNDVVPPPFQDNEGSSSVVNSVDNTNTNTNQNQNVNKVESNNVNFLNSKSDADSKSYSDADSESYSDSNSKAISGDSNSAQVAVSGDSSAKAVSGDSNSKATSGDSVSKATSGDSVSHAVTGDSKAIAGDSTSKAVAGDSNANISLNIAGDNIPEIAQSAASVIAGACQEGMSGQGITAGLSTVFDSAQCVYIRQAELHLKLQMFYYNSGLQSSAELEMQRALEYIKSSDTAVDVTGPAKVVGGVLVNLVPIALLVLLF